MCPGLVSLSGGVASKLPDYSALSSQLAKVTPSFTSASAYVVSNTVAQACPTVGTDWSASSDLPPIANADVCGCMVKSLSCVAKSGLSGNQTSQLFSTVCGLDKNACNGITANGTTGKYGAYSMCAPSQQLSFAMDQYYLTQNKLATSCDFGGNAKIQTGSTSASCKGLLSQAGTAGTGTVTTAPTGTGSSSGGGSSGTGSGSSSSSSTTKSAAGAVTVPRFDMGLLHMGLYVLVAGMVGGGMVLL